MDIILITGAAGSIGNALVEVSLSRGLKVIALDAKWPKGEILINPSLLQVGIDLVEVVNDQSALEDSVKRWFKHFESAGLLGLVNNAALQIVNPYLALTAEDMIQTFTVNVIAPMVLTTTFRDRLVSSRGAVVNVGSVHETNSKSGFSAYAASKSALAALGRGINLEEAGALRIYTVAPGAVDTPMLREGFNSFSSFSELEGYQPLRRLAQPQEIAGFVVDLVIDGSVLLSGSTVRLDGGIHGKLHDPA